MKKTISEYIRRELIEKKKMSKADLHRRRRRADAAMDWKKNHQKFIEERDREIRNKIRARFKAAFVELGSEREAMKVITKEFKDYFWIRAAFKKEVEATRDLEITKLSNLGLNSKQIADKVRVHHGTIRKIVSIKKGGHMKRMIIAVSLLFASPALAWEFQPTQPIQPIKPWVAPTFQPVQPVPTVNKYNPMSNSWSYEKQDTVNRYNPMDNSWSYEKQDSQLRYNPMGEKWEYVEE